jgi:hypothetical protein
MTQFERSWGRVKKTVRLLVFDFVLVPARSASEDCGALERYGAETARARWAWELLVKWGRRGLRGRENNDETRF